MTLQRFLTIQVIAFLSICLFAFGSIAIGQQPASVIEAPMVSIPLSTEPFISTADMSADGSWSYPVGQQMGSAVEYEIINPVTTPSPCYGSATTCSAPQYFQMRTSVLGCQKCYKVRPEDEIWVVSVRECDCNRGDLAGIEVQQFVNNSMQETTLETLTTAHLTDPSRDTLLYVHGNQTNYEYALARGFQFYNNLFSETDCVRPPVRLVLWVWQSEREKARLYNDYLIKSTRAVRLGKTMTHTLESFGNRKVTLVAFSLGAQILLSSLEEMEPQCNCEATGDKYEVALIAPATDPTYVCNVINRNVKTSIVRKTILVENVQDRAVRAMRVVLRRECPEARQIFSELAFEHHFPLAGLKLVEVSRETTPRHSIDGYTKAPMVRRAIHELLTENANGY